MDGIWDAPFFKFHGKSISGGRSISIHGAIYDAYSPLDFITAHPIVKSNDVCDSCLPYRTMSAAYPLDIKACKLLESCLYRLSVFSDDTCIIAHHLIAILPESALLINDILINRSECAKCITRKESILLLEPCNHSLRPMYHRSHKETERA